jgi:SAM-dependent methyltransferase
VWNQILRARGHNNAEAVLRQCVLYCHRLGAGLVLILIFGVCFHGSWSWMTRFLAFPRPQGWKPGPEITANMYSIDLALLKAASAPHLVSTFVPMARDSGTDTFLAAAAQLGLMSPRDRKGVRESLRAQFEEYSKAQREDGMSRTDASARYLRRTMFVATPEQFRALLIRAGIHTEVPGSLLDIGAGRGSVTASLAGAMHLNASQVTAMESSSPLRLQLKQAGYRTVTAFTELNNTKFGVVALLNVLDRCDDPQALLRDAVHALHPNGALLVATVLPYCDKVYVGAKGKVNAHRPPAVPLALPSGVRCDASQQQSFEANAAAFASSITHALNLSVVAWTRVPYLSSGGPSQSHFVLDDALFLLERRDAPRHLPPADTAHHLAPSDYDTHEETADQLPPSAVSGQDEANQSLSTLRGLPRPPPLADGYARDNEVGWWPFGQSSAPALCDKVVEGKRLRWVAEQVQQLRAGAGWGDVLDAGTGRTSLCWLLRQRPSRSITGTTPNPNPKPQTRNHDP